MEQSSESTDLRASGNLDAGVISRAFEASAIGTAIIDPAGVFLWVNDAMGKFLQRPHEKLLGATWQEFTHPDDRQVDQAMTNEVLAGRRDAYRMRKRYVLPDHSIIHGGLTVSCLRDADGNVTMLIGQVVDLTDVVEREEHILRAAERFNRAIESQLDPVMLLDAVRDEHGEAVDLRISAANPAARDFLKRPSSELAGHTLRELFTEIEAEGWWAGLLRVAETGDAVKMHETQMPSVFGQRGGWISYQAARIPDGVALTWRDISEEIYGINMQYRLMIENTADVVFHSVGGVLKWVSPSCAEVLGQTQAELVGKPTVQYWHDDDRTAAVQLREAAHAGHTGSATLRWRHSNGKYVWLDVVTRPVTESDGSIGMVGVLRDITDRVQAQLELARVMGHDALTGLITRAGMVKRVETELLQLQDRQARLAVLCFAPDRLSIVNDAHGHAVGDLALVTLASRIVKVVGESARVARGPGVSFLILCEASADDASSVSELAERLRASAKVPIPYNDHDLQMTASLGVAFADTRSTAEDVLQAATLAMNAAKESGRDQIVFAEPKIAAQVRHRVALLERAHEGIENAEFIPMYMPIVELESSRLRGYEALARWRRPDGSVWEPAAFLLAMESTQLICELDIAILRQALLALENTPASMFMSVNVSAKTLSSPMYCDLMLDAISAATNVRGPVHLEVTETALLNKTPAILHSMLRLSEIGARWYIDDFGIGYSSIAHLRDLPIDGLKLDMSFTRGIGAGDGTSIRVAQALATLADGLSLDTVAEGVEDPGQAAILAEQGWELGQGWLFGSAVLMTHGAP